MIAKYAIITIQLLMFFVGFFFYQYMQETPNYTVAVERIYFSILGMIFLVSIRKLNEYLGL